MTKLSVSYWQSPERREGRMTRTFRFLWSMLCWVTAFAAVIVTASVLRR
jgi:hypothetical protein